MNNYNQKIANLLGLNEKQVENTLALMEQGATIPFISRYRKEATGSLDEVQIAQIKAEHNKLKEIESRCKAILKSIDSQGKLTDELKTKIEKADSLTELEDLYLPYKKKRKTRASKAREAGLEPLALKLILQKDNDIDSLAESFLNESVENIESALKGARDIIAEQVNEDVQARNRIRNLFGRKAIITTKVLKDKDSIGIKYKDYFDFDEPLTKAPSHRVLAIFRAENEKVIKVDISADKEDAIYSLNKIFVRNNNDSSKQVELAVADAYKRLLKPSIENEVRKELKEKADLEAISVFTKNLRQLLLSPPLGQKRVLALDPGFRTGCKTVCMDAQGNLKHNTTIFPHSGSGAELEAVKTISELVEKYKIEIIAIGNGTASKETERFVKKFKKFSKSDAKIFIVDESGASIYSASKVAREEFPEHDVTVRGAVSIGRRLLDPLAELVKIDPKSIGVGQYQHDVDQAMLKNSLDNVVESCVNVVGVEVNTASKHLLTYVSGLGPRLAQNIVNYRSENGAFKSRKELTKVKAMGKKSFEQSAGFLRIQNAVNPLDNSAVHPEAYYIVEKMAKNLKTDVSTLINDKELQKNIKINNYVDDKVGEATLKDIVGELSKPGRDPRQKFKILEFDETIGSISDLSEGMILPGIITNVTNFGAFVDIGIKTNGLVHVSQLANKYVSNPADVVSVQQHVTVKVQKVDIERKRIQLTMKGIK